MQTHKRESVRLAPCKSRGGKAATDLWQTQDPLCRRAACEKLGPTRRTVHKMKQRNVYCGLYRVFSHDVTAAILVSQNNETAAMLVSQTNPLGVVLFSYGNAFFCSNKFV